MPKTSQITLGGRFTGLFIGSQGTGKTVAAASFPGPIMFYDFDGRMEPVKRYYPTRDDIEYKVVGAYPAPRGRYDVIDFKQFCEEFEALQDRCDYATVVIDSITSYTATVVRWQLNRKAAGKGKRLANFINVPTWDEFNGECQAVIETIELSKILPCHIIFTAHPVDKTEVIIGGGEDGKDLVRKSQSITAFGNKTPSFVPNYFNEIYSFTKEGGGLGLDYIVTTQASDKTLCKTALPLPPRMSIKNEKFFKRINDKLEEHQLELAKSVEAVKQASEEEGGA